MPKPTFSIPLPKKDLDQLLKSDKALVEYLVTLSPAQLDEFQIALRQDKKMPPAIQKTILKLFSELKKEAVKNEKAITEAILPIATGIATAMKLHDQIEELEALQRSL